MNNVFRVYTSAVPCYAPGPAGSRWNAITTIQRPSGKVIAELVAPIEHEVPDDPTAHRDASIGAVLYGLRVAKQLKARNVIVYSDSAPAVEALNRNAPPSRSNAALYLQVKALAHSFASARFHLSPYPAMSDAPVMAAGC